MLSEIIDHRADWLAVRGLTMLATVPQRNRIVTTGRGGGWKDGWFQWPLWMQVPTWGVNYDSVAEERPPH